MNLSDAIRSRNGGAQALALATVRYDGHDWHPMEFIADRVRLYRAQLTGRRIDDQTRFARPADCELISWPTMSVCRGANRHHTPAPPTAGRAGDVVSLPGSVDEAVEYPG